MNCSIDLILVASFGRRFGQVPQEFIAASVEDGHFVADRHAQHAYEMLRFLARQDDGLVSRIEGGRKEASHRRRPEPPFGRRERRLSNPI